MKDFCDQEMLLYIVVARICMQRLNCISGVLRNFKFLSQRDQTPFVISCSFSFSFELLIVNIVGHLGFFSGFVVV